VIDEQVITDAKRLAESLGQFPEPVVKPALIVVSGLPGTGKSRFSKKLSERLPLLILESDALRKTLLPSPTYTPEESSRLFRAIRYLIEELLQKGISLILDATNLSEQYREHLYNIADHLNAKMVLVRVEAPPELVYKRLKVRSEVKRPENKSDADWTVYQRMKPTVQRIGRNHFTVDTSKDITPILNKIVREVSR
jgi:hypothetical protein